MVDDGSQIPLTTQIIARGISDGLHVGAQLYVSRWGQPIANLALGNSRPGSPMRPYSLMLWLSSSKPFAAVAIAQLWEKGKLDLDDRVEKFIPDFGQKGKSPITIRHLLTHTGGFRGLVGAWEDQPWDQIISQISAMKLERDWVPGQKAGYHAHTSWYILAELVRRIDGRPFEKYVREMIFLPLEMNNCWIGGMPASTYRTYGNRIGQMHDTSGDAPKADHPLDTEAGCLQCRPGSNGRGPISELARFYETMLNHGRLEASALLSPQAVEAMSAGQRVGIYDHTFRHVIDWGLGFIKNSNRYAPDTTPYGYGPLASDRTYGHSGSQSSVGFCDPVNGLVVALVFNGMPGEAKHDQRVREVLKSLYEELLPAGNI